MLDKSRVAVVGAADSLGCNHRTVEEQQVEELFLLVGEKSTDPDVLYDLGNALDAVGRYQEACNKYRESLHFKDSPDAWLNLGGTLCTLGQKGEAEIALRRGFSLHGWPAAPSEEMRSDNAPVVVLASAVRLVSMSPKLENLPKQSGSIISLHDLLRGAGFFQPGLVTQSALAANDTADLIVGTAQALHRLRYTWAEKMANAKQDVLGMLVQLLVVGCAAAKRDVEKALGGDTLDFLAGIGLLCEPLPGLFVGSVQFTVLPCGVVAVADWPSETLVPDSCAVMAPGDDSLQLLYSIPPKALQGAHILELCCGSGIFTAYAAKAGAASVSSVDINPRCCAFTAITAHLSGIENQVEVYQGNLYEATPEKQFDLIVANPPFVAVPDERVLPLYAAGGASGLAVTQRILSGAASALTCTGGLVIVGELPSLPVSQSTPQDVPFWVTPLLPHVHLELTAVYAPEHTQSSEEYAIDREVAAASEARMSWARALRDAGAKTMTDALLIGRRLPHGSCGTWRNVLWQADGAESWLESGNTMATVRTAVEDALLANAVINADQPPLPTGWAMFSYKR